MAKSIVPQFDIDTRDLLQVVGYRQERNPRWLWLRRRTVPVYEDRLRQIRFAQWYVDNYAEPNQDHAPASTPKEDA